MGGRGSSSQGQSGSKSELKKIETLSFSSWKHPTTGEERIYINGNAVDYARSQGLFGKEADLSQIKDKKYKKKLEQEQKFAENEYTIGKYEKIYIINAGGFARVRTKEGDLYSKTKAYSQEKYQYKKMLGEQDEFNAKKGDRIIELSARKAGFKRYKQGYKFSDIKRLVDEL